MKGNSKEKKNKFSDASMLDVKKSQNKWSKEWTKRKKEVEIRNDVFQADISNCTQGWQ